MGGRYEHLGYRERLGISDGVHHGLGVREIARQIGRSASTVSRELKRGSRDGYQVYEPVWSHFDTLARRKAPRPERHKLHPSGDLFRAVSDHLRRGWSPAQIAGRLRRMHPEEPVARASHETIYVALYALPRGELRRALLAALRQGRQARRPRSRGTDRRRTVDEALRIAARPEEVAERLIPGHWEGDLIKGAYNRSAVGSLVERSSRLVMIARLDGLDATAAQHGFERLFEQIPQGLRKSLTYDRGSEMVRHAELTRTTGVKVYFADPYSPWQRGSNENANGLIREYLPKGIDLAGYSQDDLDEIAYQLNSRPRKVLDFRTPHEAYNEYLNATLAAEAAVALPN